MAQDWLDLRVPIWVRDIAFIPDSDKIVTCTGHHQVCYSLLGQTNLVSIHVKHSIFRQMSPVELCNKECIKFIPYLMKCVGQV